MGFWNRLFTRDGTLPEVPYEALDLAEVHARAQRAEPAIAEIDPGLAFGELTGMAAMERTNGRILAALAAAQLCTGDLTSGIDAINLAIFHAKEPATIFRATRIKATTLDLLLDRPADALEQYEACRNIDPENLPLKVLFAELDYRRGATPKVVRFLESVLKEGLQGPLADAEAGLHADNHEQVLVALQVWHHVDQLQLIREVLG